jgi:hypothetical protein
LGDKSLKVRKEIIIRTYDVEYIFDAAQIGKQLVTLRGGDGVPVEECIVGIRRQLHIHYETAVPYSAMVGTAVAKVGECMHPVLQNIHLVQSQLLGNYFSSREAAY